MNSIKTQPFGITKHLETDEVSATGTTSDLNTAARAKGMTEVAKQGGVTRASLYKSLSAEGNPRFETINKIVEALGGRVSVVGQ